jgi:hypothetical protein
VSPVLGLVYVNDIIGHRRVLELFDKALAEA